MTAAESKIMKYMRKAIIDYSMVDNDHGIMVGLSGGKDSLTLLKMLKTFLRSSKYKFPLAAGHVDLGFDGDLPALQRFCDELEVPLFVEKTEISQVVFEHRQEQNPCSLCANMRRGALNNLARNNGYPKVALGHHLDDVAETVLMNMCFNARVDCFKPVTYLTKAEITVIRPLIYVDERSIKTFTRQAELPIVDSCCPANGRTKREDMKDTLTDITKFSPIAKERILASLQNLEGNEWHTTKKKKVNTNVLVDVSK